MGHRQGFSTDRNNTSEDPFVHLGSSSALENNSFLHPMNNLQTDAIPYISLWNPAARANEFSLPSQGIHAQPNQIIGSATHTSFHVPLPIDAPPVTENHLHYASSSNCMIENNSFDHTVANRRGQYKRKSPMVPSVIESGSASGYCFGGSSSDAYYGRQNVNVQNTLWEPVSIAPSAYNSPTIGGETSMRNVQTRPSFNMDPQMTMPHRLVNHHPPHPDSSRHFSNHCNPVVHPSQGPNLSLLERNHVHTSTASHPRTLVAGNISNSGQIGDYHHDTSCSRNLVVSQTFLPPTTRVMGTNTIYPQTFAPTNMVGMESTVLQQAPLEEGPHFVAADGYSNRHPRSFTGAGWRNRDRSRPRLSSHRYRSLCLDALNHGRPSHEVSFVRSQLDQHGDMRLDVDNMSYEELLALGERIGSVNTGLSDDQLSKCLKEVVYLSPDQVQIEERCAICLEEYEDMSQLGTIKACSHGYHASCIKKWLSMKNACPICKAPALPDDKGKMKVA